MVNSLGPVTISFENIVDEIEVLSRDHLLFYRVQLGELFLRHFWNGDSHAFSSFDRTKEARFNLFFAEREAELTRYGLSRRQARDSIRAAIVMRTLPQDLAKQLMLTQVLLLTRLRDPTMRAKVAQLAVAQDWSVQTMRDAVHAARAGLPLDADDETPGVQPPEMPETKLAPGHLVNRAEKLATELRSWATQWAAVDGSRLRDVQRTRLRAAVVDLETQVAALRLKLGDSE